MTALQKEKELETSVMGRIDLLKYLPAVTCHPSVNPVYTVSLPDGCEETVSLLVLRPPSQRVVAVSLQSRRSITYRGISACSPGF